MKTKQDYATGYEIIKRVINRTDPYGLIGSGSPTDEFDPEITKILAQSRTWQSPDDIAATIASVLEEYFNDSYHAKDYESQSKAIFKEFKDNGLL